MTERYTKFLDGLGYYVEENSCLGTAKSKVDGTEYIGGEAIDMLAEYENRDEEGCYFCNNPDDIQFSTKNKFIAHTGFLPMRFCFWCGKKLFDK